MLGFVSQINNSNNINMVDGIISSVIGTFIYTLLIIVIGWGVYYITGRRKLLKFWGISDTKRLVIYLSNINVVKGGSKGLDNTYKTYSGLTVLYNEHAVVSKFQVMFNYLVSSSRLGKIFFADIQVGSKISPSIVSEVESVSSIISFGSPTYNIASSMIESCENSSVKFIKDMTCIQIKNYSKIISDGANGFIQKLVINNNNNHRCLFYVAGLAELGTIGAAHYLVDNWNVLQKKYKDNESFIILLRFSTSDYKNYTIDFERKIE